MDPPLSINDEYYWLRDDKRENEDVLNYLKLENEYYAANMSSSEQLVNKLYDKMLSNLKQTDEDVPYLRQSQQYYYYTRTVEGFSYNLHCRVKAEHYKLGQPVDPLLEEIILDENKIAHGFEFADVNCCTPNNSEDLIAYAVDYSGNEEYVIRVAALANHSGRSTTAWDAVGRESQDGVEEGGLQFVYLSICN